MRALTLWSLRPRIDWALRAYNAGPGEIGSEPTPAQYLEALWQATAEMVRVLKPTGSAFVDLGDKYNAYNGNRGDGQIQKNHPRPRVDRGNGLDAKGIPAKSLMLLPERYRVGCVDRLGLIARAVLVWDKPNGLPESVTDRVRRSHEDFVHLVKQPRYYSATDEVREPHAMTPQRRLSGPRQIGAYEGLNKQTMQQKDYRVEPATDGNPLGKLPGSVWSIGDSIWDGPINFCPRCGRDLTAGNGSAGRTPRDTVSIGSPESARSEPTASPTNSGSAPSLPASPLTTSAATEDASGPPTLSPSPASRTSPEETHPQPGTAPRRIATTGTSSPPPPPTPGLEVRESARCACEIGSGLDVPGSVWSVPSEPLRLADHLGVQHYAAFPSEWPRRLILGWSPPGICLDCGAGRVPVVERRYVEPRSGGTRSGPVHRNSTQDGSEWDAGFVKKDTEATILGYACSCGPHDLPQPPTHPSVILDPFGGTGTVAMVARALGRIGITVDLSMPYCRAARWRGRHGAGKAISRTNLERQGQLL